jgi:hypothetical protein
LRQFLQQCFHTKDLSKLQYFLGIEVTRSKIGIDISHKKYVLDILEETGLLGAWLVDTCMDPNHKLVRDGELFSDPTRY